jgi:hypothetical protein
MEGEQQLSGFAKQSFGPTFAGVSVQVVLSGKFVLRRNTSKALEVPCLNIAGPCEATYTMTLKPLT